MIVDLDYHSVVGAKKYIVDHGRLGPLRSRAAQLQERRRQRGEGVRKPGLGRRTDLAIAVAPLDEPCSRGREAGVADGDPGSVGLVVLDRGKEIVVVTMDYSIHQES